jgi:serine/threonine-protein kinase
MTGAETHLTQTGMVIGTVCNMAPEHMSGNTDITAAADLWALTVVFYELLTGTLPFIGKDFHSRYLNVLTRPFISPKQFVPDCPDTVESFLSVGLAKDVSERFQSAQAMLSVVQTLPGYEERDGMIREMVEKTMTPNAATREFNDQADHDESDVEKEMMRMIVEGGTPSRSPKTPMPGTEGAVIQTKANPEGMAQSRPYSWTNTSVETVKNRWRKTIVRIEFAAITVLLIVLGFLVFRKLSTPKEPLSVPVTTSPSSSTENTGTVSSKTNEAEKKTTPIKEPLSKEVIITVKVVPEDAAVFFDGEKMPRLKFLVLRSDKASSLKVEAPGFKPHVEDVVPSENRVISVRLEPVDIDEKEVPTVIEPKTSKRPRAHPKKKSEKWNKIFIETKKEEQKKGSKKDWFKDF